MNSNTNHQGRGIQPFLSMVEQMGWVDHSRCLEIQQLLNINDEGRTVGGQRLHQKDVCTAAGDPASYEKDNRKAWWPGELSLEGGAASSVYRCVCQQLSSVRNARQSESNQLRNVSTEHADVGSGFCMRHRHAVLMSPCKHVCPPHNHA